jgi:hypothetical protein
MRHICPILVRKDITVLVIDNASYHTRKHDPAPTMSSKYSDMTIYCDAHGIVYPFDRATTDRKVRIVVFFKQFVRSFQVKDRIKKPDFYKLYVQDYAKEHKEYAVERIAEEYGIIILRLPPYHCFFNPIEPPWGFVS